MGKIEGSIVYFCVLFLAVCWPNGILGAPSCDPLLVQNYYQILAVRRQQLLNQAKSLLDQLSSPSPDDSVNVSAGIIPAYDTPSHRTLDTLETSLLLDLVNRLEALKSNSIVASNPTSRPVISEATFASLVNQYQELKVLIANCMPSEDNQTVQLALDDLHSTGVIIFNGILTKAELPNLCSKILTFNARLTATNAPAKVQDAVTDYIKSLTSALTGQSEVTISAVCRCLNDLETSVVTVVECDAPQRVQQLLSNLVNAVTNVVISGGGVGCNVIDVVKRYVASINQAIQQDESARAKKIYRSVLSFEDELYKALIYSEPTDVAVVSSSSPATVSENSASTLPQVESTTPLLRDATAIVSNGATFIIKDVLVTDIDEDGNVVGLVRSGTYQIYDPSTYASSSGSFAVQDGSIESSPDGSIYLKSYGVYDVDLPSSSDKLQGNFAVEYNAVVQVNGNGKRQLVESGIYTLTDAALGIPKYGEFIIVNSISKTNPDGSIEVIKTGALSVDESDATSPIEQPFLDSDSIYYLFTDHVSENPNSGDERGRGMYSIKNLKTGDTESGTYVISSSSKATNSDGSTDVTMSGVFYDAGVDSDSESSLIIMNGADFTITVHEVNVTDSNGEVHRVRTGALIETDPNTGIVKSGRSMVPNSIINYCSDGSTYTTDFGKITNFETILPTPNPSPASTNCLDDSSSSTINSAKPLPITKDSLKALMNSLNTVKTVEPPAESETQSPSSVDCSPELDVASMFPDKTAFIVNELVTPVLDEEGEVIDQVRMGTYFFQNSLTNTSWSGSFDVDDFTAEKSSSGQVAITASGKIEVTSPTNESLPSAEAQFSIVNLVSLGVDNNGIATISGEGSYTVTDLGTDGCTTGTYVVENTIARPCPGGAIEIIKAGLLFVNNSDGSSSDCAKYDGYFLVDDHIFNEADCDGNLGTGMYSLTDPKSNEQIRGTYVIEKLSTTENDEGRTVVTTEGVIYVNGRDSNSTQTSFIVNGAKFLAVDTLDRSNGSVGTGTFTQTDPETGLTIRAYRTDLLNVATIRNPDGSTNVRKFHGLTIIGDCDNSHTQDSTSSSETVPLVSDTPSIDPAAIVTDGAVFIINKHVVGTLESGEYIIMDPKTNISHSGYFSVDQSSTSSSAPGQIDVEESGTFVVNAPDDGSGTRQPCSEKINYSIQQHVFAYYDDNGGSRVTDSGTFALVNLNAGTAKLGTFVVANTVIKMNPDGSTIVTKSGILYVNEFCSTSETSEEGTPPLGDRGNFLRDDHIFATPDSSGNRGDGVYSISDPKSNDYTSGMYSIQDLTITRNPDESVTLKTSGLIYVNSSRSISSNPMLVIIDGAEFTLEDQLTYVTDPNGNIHAVGSGVFTQIDPETGDALTGNYQIQNVLNTHNADGSHVIIKSGNFMYPIISDATTESSTASTSTLDSSPATWTGCSKSGPEIPNLADLEACLETLTVALNELKAQAGQTSSGTVGSTTLGSHC